MVAIFLRNGQLDMGGADFSVSGKPFIFNTDMAEPFSTDFEVPKTERNVNILGTAGLLDFTSQPLGSVLEPVNLCIGGQMTDAMLQVVSVSEHSISLCVFERPLPAILDSDINTILKDVPVTTIYHWNYRSDRDVPDVFRRYKMCDTYNDRYFQYHPSLPLNGIMARIEQVTGTSMPRFDNGWRLMASRKSVCPQCPWQMIAGTFSDSDTMVLRAGQSIVNDAPGWNGIDDVGDSDVTEITFNRSCTATIYPYISWKKRLTAGNNFFVIGIYKNGEYVTGILWETVAGGDMNGIERPSSPVTMDFQAGDTLSFRFAENGLTDNRNRFKLISACFDITYTNYVITEDDNETDDLVYCYDTPCLWEESHDGGMVGHYFEPDNPNPYVTIYNEAGVTQRYVTLDLPYKSFSYIGFYSSLPKVRLKDFLRGMAWAMGKHLVKDGDGIILSDSGKTAVISGNIREFRPSSTHIGQTTRVLWADGTVAGETAINNEWLESEKVIHQSALERVEKASSHNVAYIRQYTLNTETDTDGNTTTEAEFWENDGMVITSDWLNPDNNRTYSLVVFSSLPFYDLGALKKGVVEADISTFSFIPPDTDYIYLDGRKFWVVEWDTDTVTGTTELTALLKPNPIILEYREE